MWLCFSLLAYTRGYAMSLADEHLDADQNEEAGQEEQSGEKQARKARVSRQFSTRLTPD